MSTTKDKRRWDRQNKKATIHASGKYELTNMHNLAITLGILITSEL